MTTIGFAEFGLATITDQYAHLGVNFTDGNDTTRGEDFVVFPRDGWGLDGNFDIQFEFDSPRASAAVYHPGGIEFDLFQGGNYLGTATFNSIGPDNFSGITTSFMFDKVILKDPGVSEATIDNLLFVTIPCPATLFPLSWFLFPSRNRRRAIRLSLSRIDGTERKASHDVQNDRRRHAHPLHPFPFGC